MFQRKKELQEKRLLELKARFKALCDENAERLRALIPPEEIWRFFINVDHQKNPKSTKLKYLPQHLNNSIKEIASELQGEAQQTLIQLAMNWNLTANQSKMSLQDFITLNSGCLQYENETNYLLALIVSFANLNQKNFPNNAREYIEMLKKLHGEVLSTTDNTSYDLENSESEEEQPGQIRVSQEAGYTLHPNNCSFDGILELLNRNTEYHDFDVRFYDPKKQNEVIGTIKVNKESLKLIKEHVRRLDETQQKNKHATQEKIFYYDFPLSHCIESFDRLEFQKQIKQNKHHTEIVLRELAKINLDDAKSFAKMIYSLIQNPNKWHIELLLMSRQIKDEPKKMIEQTLEKFYNNFEINMKCERLIDQLYAIADLLQDTDELHPFIDGNGRILYLLMLPYLLHSLQLPSTMMNSISRISLREREFFVDEILNGIENTLTLVEKLQKGEKEIFTVNTKAYLESLESSAFLKEYQSYFNKLAEIEASGKDRSLNHPSFTKKN